MAYYDRDQRYGRWRDDESDEGRFEGERRFGREDERFGRGGMYSERGAVGGVGGQRGYGLERHHVMGLHDDERGYGREGMYGDRSWGMGRSDYDRFGRERYGFSGDYGREGMYGDRSFGREGMGGYGREVYGRDYDRFGREGTHGDRFGAGRGDYDRFGRERYGFSGDYDRDRFGRENIYGDRWGAGRGDYDRDRFGREGIGGGFGREGMHGDFSERRYAEGPMRGISGVHGRGMGFGEHIDRFEGRGLLQRGYDRLMGDRRMGKGPKGYQRSDERIREDICDRLTDHDWIDAGDIDVKVQNCEVTLLGNVQDRNTKRAVEDLAESVLGVKEVHNQIKVKREEPITTGATGVTAGTTATTTTPRSDKMNDQQRNR